MYVNHFNNYFPSKLVSLVFRERMRTLTSPNIKLSLCANIQTLASTHKLTFTNTQTDRQDRQDRKRLTGTDLQGQGQTQTQFQ